jgi:plastocyanin
MPTTSRRPHLVRLAVAAGAIVLVAGCSGSSDNVESGSGGQATASPPVSLSGTVNDHGEKDLSGDQPSLDLELDDSYFAPTYVRAAPGAVVKVELENEGSKTHTFTLDDKSVDVKLDGGGKSTVDVTMPASGSLHFFCQIHSGAGMQGAFVVTEASGGSGSGAGAPSTTATTMAPSTTAASGGGYGY